MSARAVHYPAVPCQKRREDFEANHAAYRAVSEQHLPPREAEKAYRAIGRTAPSPITRYDINVVTCAACLVGIQNIAWNRARHGGAPEIPSWSV